MQHYNERKIMVAHLISQSKHVTL